MDLESQRLAFSADNCSIGRTLDLVGDRWTMLILREAFFGLRRFDDFHRALGCARNVLSGRLAALVDHGLLDRVQYRDPGQRRRHEYHLTAKGAELFPALLALLDWGDRWTADAAGPAVEVRHRGCGAPVHARLVCDQGHDDLDARDLQPVAGSGARMIAPMR